MPLPACIMGMGRSVHVMRRGRPGPVQWAREPSAVAGRDTHPESEGGMEGVGEDVRVPHAQCGDAAGGR